MAAAMAAAAAAAIEEAAAAPRATAGPSRRRFSRARRRRRAAPRGITAGPAGGRPRCRDPARAEAGSSRRGGLGRCSARGPGLSRGASPTMSEPPIRPRLSLRGRSALRARSEEAGGGRCPVSTARIRRPLPAELRAFLGAELSGPSGSAGRAPQKCGGEARLFLVA